MSDAQNKLARDIEEQRQLLEKNMEKKNRADAIARETAIRAAKAFKAADEATEMRKRADEKVTAAMQEAKKAGAEAQDNATFKDKLSFWKRLEKASNLTLEGSFNQGTNKKEQESDSPRRFGKV